MSNKRVKMIPKVIKPISVSNPDKEGDITYYDEKDIGMVLSEWEGSRIYISRPLDYGPHEPLLMSILEHLPDEICNVKINFTNNDGDPWFEFYNGVFCVGGPTPKKFWNLPFFRDRVGQIMLNANYLTDEDNEECIKDIESSFLEVVRKTKRNGYTIFYIE